MTDILTRRVQIPSVGDALVLDEDWTFSLFHEYRNETLLAVFAPTVKVKDSKKFTTVTLPRGTEIRVDRIYIRKGVKDYDSITFLAKGVRKEKVAIPKVQKQPKPDLSQLGPQPEYPGWNAGASKKQAYELWQTKSREIWDKFMDTPEWQVHMAAVHARDLARRLARPVRFWAKLYDVNKMVVRAAGWTEREVEAERTRAIDLE